MTKSIAGAGGEDRRWRREQAMARGAPTEGLKRGRTAPGSPGRAHARSAEKQVRRAKGKRCRSAGPGPLCSESRALGFGGFRVRHRAADIRRRLVLPQTFIDDLAQQVVLRPGQVFDFGNEFGPHPMHPA
jgi:hypothetical protein